MKVGLFAPMVTPDADREYLCTLGRVADERGFHSLWLGEHVVVFDDDPSPYPYSDDGRMPGVSGTRGLPEQFTTLAFLAARTERVRLGTGIAILPIRHPVLTAKEAANLDWISGGRFDLGVGLGWSESEYEAMGVPWRARGDRLDAYLELITGLWRAEVSEHHSAFYELPPCRMDPKPVQPGGVPVYVGGHNRRTFERVAAHGRGWYAFALAPEEVAEGRERLAAALADRDRDPGGVETIVCPYTRPLRPEDLAAYRDAGVDQLLVTVIGGDAGQLERRLDRAATFVEAAAALG